MKKVLCSQRCMHNTLNVYGVHTLISKATNWKPNSKPLQTNPKPLRRSFSCLPSHLLSESPFAGACVKVIACLCYFQNTLVSISAFWCHKMGRSHCEELLSFPETIIMCVNGMLDTLENAQKCRAILLQWGNSGRKETCCYNAEIGQILQPKERIQKQPPLSWRLFS